MKNKERKKQLTNQTWPKEPWKIEKLSDNQYIAILGAEPGEVACITWTSFTNSLKRAVDCVNALAGKENPEAFVKKAEKLMEGKNAS